MIRLCVGHIRFKIFEAGHQRRGKIPHSPHLLPFVGRTIRAQLSDAFVAVAGTGKSGTRNIQENAAESTFLFHAFLLGWGKIRVPYLSEPPQDCQEGSHFLYGGSRSRRTNNNDPPFYRTFRTPLEALDSILVIS